MAGPAARMSGLWYLEQCSKRAPPRRSTDWQVHTDTNVDTNAHSNGSHNARPSRVSRQHLVLMRSQRTLHVVPRVPHDVLRVSSLLVHLTAPELATNIRRCQAATHRAWQPRYKTHGATSVGLVPLGVGGQAGNSSRNPAQPDICGGRRLRSSLRS